MITKQEKFLRPSGVLNEQDAETFDGGLEKPEKQIAKQRKFEPAWGSIIVLSLLHIQALYGVILLLTGHVKWQTVVFTCLVNTASGLGISAGAHRLWSHRAYKAKWPLRLMLMLFNTLSFQQYVFRWARDHRVHHKFSDTDADPHNITRGFFFSHVGWLLCKKLPDVKEAGKRVDMSDLYADPILRFQKKYWTILMPTICFILPTVIPPYFWGESWLNAWLIASCLRVVYSMNATWCVNSVAHTFGDRPYDKSITPGENLIIAILVLGEGWHNYHHAFPWDYKTAELGFYGANLTTAFLDLMAKIGLAYDLKTVSEDVIRARKERTGHKANN